MWELSRGKCCCCSLRRRTREGLGKSYHVRRQRRVHVETQKREGGCGCSRLSQHETAEAEAQVLNAWAKLCSVTWAVAARSRRTSASKIHEPKDEGGATGTWVLAPSRPGLIPQNRSMRNRVRLVDEEAESQKQSLTQAAVAWARHRFPGARSAPFWERGGQSHLFVLFHVPLLTPNYCEWSPLQEMPQKENIQVNKGAYNGFEFSCSPIFFTVFFNMHI